MKRFIFLVFLIILVNSTHQRNIAEANTGWIKVCQKENYKLKASQCPDGVGIETAHKSTCVCINGL
jgi:hypothetical protein